ncbi:MAG: hypothetical protein P8X67_21560, partial [Syntrophobacterales bacterium]
MAKLGRELKGRDFKQKVIDLLKADDFAGGLETFRSYPARRVINPLFSCLCSTEPEIKWRAMTSPIVSGTPQPMPPDSSFKFQIIRLITTRADS